MTTKPSPVRMLCGTVAFSIALVCAMPALAETAPPPKIDAADTAWMIAATALVLMMTVPGLALFYCGMVRKKNVLATMAQSMLCVVLCSVLWAVAGYSLTFGSEGTILGNLDRLFLQRHRHGHGAFGRQDHPGNAVHDVPDDLRDHHGRAGRGLGRGPHAVLRLRMVRDPLDVHRLCADRALGVGRRLPDDRGPARLRRRHGRASQRRRRRARRRLCDRQPLRLRHRQLLALQSCRWP